MQRGDRDREEDKQAQVGLSQLEGGLARLDVRDMPGELIAQQTLAVERPHVYAASAIDLVEQAA